MSYDETPSAVPPAASAPVPPAAGPAFPPPAPPIPPGRPSPFRWLAMLVAAVLVLFGSAALGAAAENQWGAGGSSSGQSGTSSDNGSSSSSGASSSIDTSRIADSASPAIVNIQTTLEDGEAAGSGMVISKSGVVLTNNHVIEGAKKIEVEIGVTGKTYSAEVVGYDVADDVAVLQLQNASNMKTVSIGNPSTVSVNDPVVAIGNAQGKFGTPTVVSGYVSDTSRTISAGDGGSSTETLRDMIEVQADIQSGDSGGPLLDANGKVIGINSAAEVSGGGQFGFGPGSSSGTGGVGYAIPITRAVQIAQQIAKGDESGGVYVGSQRALLGVGLDSGTQGFGSFGSDSGSGSDTSGASVAQVQSGGAADGAGIAVGDTIVAVDGNSVGSSDDLRTAMQSRHPGDSVRIDWVDSSGSSHHATVTLQAGPPA